MDYQCDYEHININKSMKVSLNPNMCIAFLCEKGNIFNTYMNRNTMTIKSEHIDIAALILTAHRTDDIIQTV